MCQKSVNLKGCVAKLDNYSHINHRFIKILRSSEFAIRWLRVWGFAILFHVYSFTTLSENVFPPSKVTRIM